GRGEFAVFGGSWCRSTRARARGRCRRRGKFRRWLGGRFGLRPNELFYKFPLDHVSGDMNPRDVVVAHLREKQGIGDAGAGLRPWPHGGDVPDQRHQRNQPPQQNAGRERRLARPRHSVLWFVPFLLRHFLHVAVSNRTNIWIIISCVTSENGPPPLMEDRYANRPEIR